MREERLKLEFFDEFRVSDCKGIQEVNEHMEYCFEGVIPIARMKEYASLGNDNCWTHVYVISEGDEVVWICGVVKDMTLQVTGQTCRMQLTLTSGTDLMDLQKHIRTFQAESLRYEQLLETCNSGYENAAKIMTVGKTRQIGQLVVQYQETDWEFIKRLASQNQTVVVPDTETKGSKYYFGLPERDAVITGDMQEYNQQCDMKAYWERKNQGFDVTPRDFNYYIWKSRDIYQLGDKGVIEGRTLIVGKIETGMRGNELYHTYYMKPKFAFQTNVQDNVKVSGASLFGTVTKIQKEQVQVTLREDENADHAGERWFSYATVYSSADGTGWYCMPEKGDGIRLYFPTGKEEQAYVASAYHEAGSGLRKDPSCKFWRNKQGKEIRLAKDRILLTNNHGSYMEMSDENGIEIVSNGSIRIQAGARMEIASQNSLIELNANKRVSIRQGTTELTVDREGFNVKGSRIKL